MRGDNQIIIVDVQIVNRHGGQIQFQRLPVRAVVD